MDYVTVEMVSSQAIPDLFTPGISTSTRCVTAYFSIDIYIPNLTFEGQATTSPLFE